MFVLFLALAAHADAPADALGRQVAASCGDPYALEDLRFTFVVTAGGAEKARRSHDWSPRQGTVTVTADGQSTTLHVEANMPSDAQDPRWARLAPGVAPEVAAAAWGRFVNDSYWLLAPCKVMDGGVMRGVGPDGALTLAFAGVGLTPGDRYELHLDPTDHHVQSWTFHLQSGREDSFDWLDYQAVGPLHLSLRRQSTTSDAVVSFEDVSAR